MTDDLELGDLPSHCLPAVWRHAVRADLSALLLHLPSRIQKGGLKSRKRYQSLDLAIEEPSNYFLPVRLDGARGGGRRGGRRRGPFPTSLYTVGAKQRSSWVCVAGVGWVPSYSTAGLRASRYWPQVIQVALCLRARARYAVMAGAMLSPLRGSIFQRMILVVGKAACRRANRQVGSGGSAGNVVTSPRGAWQQQLQQEAANTAEAAAAAAATSS